MSLAAQHHKTFDKAQRKVMALNTLEIKIKVEVKAKAAEVKSNNKYGLGFD